MPNPHPTDENKFTHNLNVPQFSQTYWWTAYETYKYHRDQYYLVKSSLWLDVCKHNSPHRPAVGENTVDLAYLTKPIPHQANPSPCSTKKKKKSRNPKSGKHYTLATLMNKAILLNEGTIRLHAVQYKKRVIFFSSGRHSKIS